MIQFDLRAKSVELREEGTEEDDSRAEMTALVFFASRSFSSQFERVLARDSSTDDEESTSRTV